MCIASQASQSSLSVCSFANQLLPLLIYRDPCMNTDIYKKWDKDALQSDFVVKILLILTISYERFVLYQLLLRKTKQCNTTLIKDLLSLKLY